MVDTTQADRAVTAYKQNLTTLAAPTNTITTNMQKMNQQFAASVNPIKQQGNALATLNTNLKATQATSVGLGTKIKTTASNFAGFATGLSATTSGVLQLGAGFRDYNDAQIAVERQQRKLSLATEAQHKAQDKLDKLTKAGVTSGKEYAQAQLDVSQANQQLSIMTQLLGERQEDMFDAQSQFVASVIPVTLGAVGTLGSAFKDLGLNMGKIKGAFSTVASGATGLIGKLSSLGSGATGAATELGTLGKGSTGLTGLLGKLGIGASGAAGNVGILSKVGTGAKGIFTALGGAITGIIPAITGMGGKSGEAAKILSNVNVQGTNATGMFGKFKGGLNSAAGAIGLTTKGLIGMSLALGGVVLGVIELDKQLKLAQWAHEFDAAGGASHRTIEQLRVDLQNAKTEASSWGNTLKTAFQAIDFSNIFKKPEDLKKQLNFMDDVVKSIEQTLNRKEAQEAFSKGLAGILASPISNEAKANIKGQIDHIQAILKNDFNFAAREGVTAQQSSDYTNAIVAGLIKNLETSLANANFDVIIKKGLAKKTMFVGGVGKEFVEVADGMALVTAQTDPFNAGVAKANVNLDDTDKKAAALKGTFATMTKSVGSVNKDFVDLGNGMALVTSQTDPFNAGIAKANTHLDDTDAKAAKIKGTFATMTKFVGGANQGFIEVGKGMALVTHQTDPFNAGVAKMNVHLDTTIDKDKELQEVMLKDKPIIQARTETYVGLVKQLQATYNTTGKNMAQLQGFAAQQESINKQITGFQQDQEVGYKEVEASILGVAFAHNVNTEKMVDMVRNGKDEVAQLRMMVAESINFTKALDDEKTNLELVSEGFLGGIIQAEEFFNGLVKNTEQEGIFNLALAAGAEELGVTSDMLAFSSGKMQELLKDVQDASAGFDDMSIAAAKNTGFLKDNVLIESQINKGLKDGREAANDWAISLFKTTAQTASFHDQLLHVVADMTGLEIPIGTTNEALQKMGTTFVETQDAGLALAKMMTENLEPAFGRVSKIFQAKSFKDMKKALKDLELPKGFTHGLDDAFKGSQKAAESARKVGTAMDILVTKGVNFSKSDLTKNMKAFGNELDRMSKIKGTNKAIDGILMSLKTMSPQELGAHSKSMQFLVDTINEFGFLPTDKADEFFKMFNAETAKVKPNATTAATGFDKLTSSMVAFNTQVGKMQGLDQGTIDTLNRGLNVWMGGTDKGPTTGKEEKTTMTVDNHQALSAVDVVATRINDLGKINPQISLMNTNAFNSIETVAGEIDHLTKIKPQISLQNRNAISAIETTADEIDHLTKIKPQISLQNKNAINAIETVAEEIDKLTKIKPQISLQNRNAISAIDTVRSEIEKLGDLKPVIHVKVQVDGMPKGAAHGMHETLTEDTLIQAHKGERVDIQKSGLDDTSMRSLGASGNSPPPGFGGMGMGMGNLTVNNVIDLGGDTIVRSFKRKLGNNLYTYGK